MEDVKEIICHLRMIAFRGITDKAYPVEKFREIRDLANKAIELLDTLADEPPKLKRKKK